MLSVVSTRLDVSFVDFSMQHVNSGLPGSVSPTMNASRRTPLSGF